MTNPLQFGDSARPLYGVYHPPAARAGKRPAILLFNPFGEEAIRAFRIYRLLAEKCAGEGAPAMRFDYFATGDSAGTCEEASLAGFIESALDAHEELKDMSGAKDVVWIGLRLGAAVAMLAAQKAGEPPARVILWDPVVSGASYLEEIEAGHRAAILAQTGAAPRLARPHAESLGFAISETLASELATLDLRVTKKTSAKRVVVIAGSAAPTDPAFSDALAKTGAETIWRRSPGEVSWNSDKALNSFVVPTKTLDLIILEALA